MWLTHQPLSLIMLVLVPVESSEFSGPRHSYTAKVEYRDSTSMAATAQPFPSGGTWFDTLTKSFADVPIDTAHDNAIPTTDFLDAADSLTSLFGMSTSSSTQLDAYLPQTC